MPMQILPSEHMEPCGNCSMNSHGCCFSFHLYIFRYCEERKIIFSLQFFEADEQHKHVEAELRSRLATLEMEAAQHQAVVDGLTRKYMETIEKLQNDKAKLEVSPTDGESMLRDGQGSCKSSVHFVECKVSHSRGGCCLQYLLSVPSL